MKFKLVIIGFTSFLVFFLLLLPYNNIYEYFFNKLLSYSKIDATYKIAHANLLGFRLKDVVINTPKKISIQNIKLKDVKVQINPLGILWGHWITIKIVIGQGIAIFYLNNISNKTIILQGSFAPSMFYIFFKEPISKIIKGVKGSSKLICKLMLHREKILIKDLQIEGGIKVKASGYMDRYGIHLIGMVKIGRLKQRFGI